MFFAKLHAFAKLPQALKLNTAITNKWDLITVPTKVTNPKIISVFKSSAYPLPKHN